MHKHKDIINRDNTRVVCVFELIHFLCSIALLSLSFAIDYYAGGMNYILYYALSYLLYTMRLAYVKSSDEANEATETERKLRLSEETCLAKSKFLSRMSHEIRTPINAIVGIAELIDQDVEADNVTKKNIKNYLHETKNAASYLLLLINDILGSAKIDSNKIELQPHVLAVNEYNNSIVTLARPMANARNVNFVVN